MAALSRPPPTRYSRAIGRCSRDARETSKPTGAHAASSTSCLPWRAAGPDPSLSSAPLACEADRDHGGRALGMPDNHASSGQSRSPNRCPKTANGPT